MKITYSKEIGNCDFTLVVFETNEVIKTSGELVGKDNNGKLVHIDINKVIKIQE